MNENLRPRRVAVNLRAFKAITSWAIVYNLCLKPVVLLGQFFPLGSTFFCCSSLQVISLFSRSVMSFSVAAKIDFSRWWLEMSVCTAKAAAPSFRNLAMPVEGLNFQRCWVGLLYGTSKEFCLNNSRPTSSTLTILLSASGERDDERALRHGELRTLSILRLVCFDLKSDEPSLRLLDLPSARSSS